MFNIRDFCKETNLHGFIYIIQPTRHKAEKIFWSFSIFISFILTGILISKFIIESQLNPIVIYTDQNVINVHDINFPAVSICPGVILEIDHFDLKFKAAIDYNEIISQYYNGTFDIGNMTLNQLKMMQIASLVAGDLFMSKNFPNLSISTEDLVERLADFGPVWSVRNFTGGAPVPYNFYGNWSDRYQAPMIQNLWKTGFCQSFNIPDPEKMYYVERISSDFWGRKTTLLGTDVNDLSNYFHKLSYPVKAQEPGRGLYLGYSPSYGDFSQHAIPDVNYNGLKLIIHEPYESISNDVIVRHAREHSYTKIFIIPEISAMDDYFMEFDLDKRLCYFKNERELKFFKIYNKVNCEHECLTNRTLEQCKCVQFYMVRGKDTRICGVRNEKCFRKVEKDFLESKEECKCYDPCETVKYDVHTM